MKVSHRGLVAIEAREGVVLKAYRDSKGLPTIGVGHLIVPGDGYSMSSRITQAECDALFAKDVERYENAVNSLGVKLAQNQFDALVSFCLNIGTGGFKGSTVAKRLKAGDYNGAAEAMMRWVKPKEITGRRRSEQKQFLTPYPKDSATLSPTANSIPLEQPTVSDLSESTPALPSESISATTEQTTVETSAGDAAVSTTTTESQNVVIEAREEKGFFKSIWKKITGLSIFNGGISSVSDYAQQAQTFGLSHEFWERVIWIVAGASLIYLAYEGYNHWSRIKEEKEKDRLLASVNTTPSNTVQFASPENIAKFEALGYKVIRRK